MDDKKMIASVFFVFSKEERVSSLPLTHNALRDVIGELIN